MSRLSTKQRRSRRRAGVKAYPCDVIVYGRARVDLKALARDVAAEVLAGRATFVQAALNAMTSAVVRFAVQTITQR